MRHIAAARGKIYVITDAIARDGKARTRKVAKKDNACGNAVTLTGPPRTRVCNGSKNPKVACPNGVAVPVALYKIIYDPVRKEAYAYVLTNVSQTPRPDRLRYLDKSRVSVAALQKLTGVQFFGDVPESARGNLLNNCTGDRPWTAPAPKPKSLKCK
jgi:DNA/RNA endonuclease G (NUC1)